MRRPRHPSPVDTSITRARYDGRSSCLRLPGCRCVAYLSFGPGPSATGKGCGARVEPSLSCRRRLLLQFNVPFRYAYTYVAINAEHERPEITDFPLSKPLRDLEPIPQLTMAAVHLAAQVPSQWLKNGDTIRGAELALRKVVYRALLQPVLQVAVAQSNVTADPATLPERAVQPGLGETPGNRRLGKLNDKAYQDWPTFLERATDKLGIDLAAVSTSLPDWFTHEAARLKIESALFVLQTLRCILGPLIETLILLDRRDWIKDELAEMNDRGQEVEVDIVNLFDQATGSGRNVALVIKPHQVRHRVFPVIECVQVSGGCTKPHPAPNAIQ
jgi:hypothetical protein